MEPIITLNHGAGGEATGALIRLVRETLGTTAPDDDAFVFTPGGPLAMTTDGYVVTPRFFPGGDLGKLAVCGTANDLAALGAGLRHLALALIIEEGFVVEELTELLRSLGATAASIGAAVVTGDCKVVGKGQADGLFIVTTGCGEVRYPVRRPLVPGDAVILTGTAGDHGTTILAVRTGLRLEGALASDCAPLFPLVRAAAETGAVKFVRDATRGGVAAVLNEIAGAARVGMRVLDSALPVSPAARVATGLLGLDPWHLANEGKLVLVAAAADADRILAALRREPIGKDAVRLGEVIADRPGTVLLRTVAGTDRFLLPISGDPVPRIC